MDDQEPVFALLLLLLLLLLVPLEPEPNTRLSTEYGTEDVVEGGSALAAVKAAGDGTIGGDWTVALLGDESDRTLPTSS